MPVPPIVSIVGRSGSGKTTLLEKLIGELKRRGHRVAVIKHHYHRGLEFDRPGKDSWRFAQAGADHVVIAGPDKVAHVRRFEREPSLAEVVTDVRDVDLILTEGYKHAHAPKIEVSREGSGAKRGDCVPRERLLSSPEELIAIASDRRFDVDVPQFGLEGVSALADLIEARFLRLSS